MPSGQKQEKYNNPQFLSVKIKQKKQKNIGPAVELLLGNGVQTSKKLLGPSEVSKGWL